MHAVARYCRLKGPGTRSSHGGAILVATCNGSVTEADESGATVR